MKSYTIWRCNQFFTGNKRIHKTYENNKIYYDTEYETELGEWYPCRTVKGIKAVYDIMGKNSNVVNDFRLLFYKKWYNEMMTFRNQREKKYYIHLASKKRFNSFFGLSDDEELSTKDIQNFAIKFDFIARDSFKGKLFESYYCITDENNYIIDYDEIIKQIRLKNNVYNGFYCSNPFKKPRQHKGYTRYGHYHWGYPDNKIINEMKQSLTPQEIDEIFYEYGIHLKPYKEKRKHLHEYLAYEDFCKKNERNWKKFRKHQWKEKIEKKKNTVVNYHTP